MFCIVFITYIIYKPGPVWPLTPLSTMVPPKTGQTQDPAHPTFHRARPPTKHGRNARKPSQYLQQVWCTLLEESTEHLALKT